MISKKELDELREIIRMHSVKEINEFDRYMGSRLILDDFKVEKICLSAKLERHIINFDKMRAVYEKVKLVLL